MSYASYEQESTDQERYEYLKKLYFLNKEKSESTDPPPKTPVQSEKNSG